MSNVDNFLSKLQAQQPKAKSTIANNTRKIEKISLNFEGNYGRYQILPFNNVVNDYPFVVLHDTHEINIPTKFVAQDGTETINNQRWIKILPKSAYIMKSASGETISSLTPEEDALLTQAHAIWKDLYKEFDVRNNPEDLKITRDLLRRRNYTIFHAYCLNKWKDSSRQPERQNFSGLFVATAKGFVTKVLENINETEIMSGPASEWIPSVYNDKLVGRDGFLLFSIARDQSSAGYSVSVSHKPNAGNMVGNVEIPAEDAELMKDPLVSFLGWQVRRDTAGDDPATRRLFNADYIKEAIAFMGQQLSAIRSAKAAGMNIQEAINNTTRLALQNATPVVAATTNDPMLSQEVQQDVNVDVAAIHGNNDAPFQTPPAAHIDPISGSPVNSAGNNYGGNFGNPNAGNGFAAPSFAAPTAASGQNTDDLPF